MGTPKKGSRDRPGQAQTQQPEKAALSYADGDLPGRSRPGGEANRHHTMAIRYWSYRSQIEIANTYCLMRGDPCLPRGRPAYFNFSICPPAARNAPAPYSW